jgi:hypothetical protein
LARRQTVGNRLEPLLIGGHPSCEEARQLSIVENGVQLDTDVVSIL